MALFPQESKKDAVIFTTTFTHFPQSPKLSLRDLNDAGPSYQPANIPISLTSSPSHKNLQSAPFVVSSNTSSKRKIILSQKKPSSRLKSTPKSSLVIDHNVKYLDLSQMHSNSENTDSQRAFMISSAKAIREETPIPTARRQSNVMVLALHDQSNARNLNSGIGNMPTEHFNDKFQKKYEHFRRTQNNTLKQYLGKFRSITEIKNRAEGKGNMITVHPTFTRISADLDIATSRLFANSKQKTIYLEKKTKEMVRIKRKVLDGEVPESASKRPVPKEYEEEFVNYGGGGNERRPTSDFDNYYQSSMTLNNNNNNHGGYHSTRPQDTSSLVQFEKEKFVNQVRVDDSSYPKVVKTVTQNFYLGEKDSPRKNLHKKTFSLFNYSDGLSKYDNSVYQEKMHYRNEIISAQNSPLSPKQDPFKVASPKMQTLRSSHDEAQLKKQLQGDNVGGHGPKGGFTQRRMVVCKQVAPDLILDPTVEASPRRVKHNRVASATMTGHFMSDNQKTNAKGRKVVKKLEEGGTGKEPKAYIVSKGLSVVTDVRKSQSIRYEQESIVMAGSEPQSADTSSPMKNMLSQSRYKETSWEMKQPKKEKNQKADISDQFSDFKLEGW